jgi:ketosteroid isomerase-like protein
VVVTGVDEARTGSGAAAMLGRLSQAVNDHDVAALVACFAPGYRNETPAHPQRGFTGREQVRRNWEQIFAAIPDLRAQLLRCAVDGDTAWTEWEHSGTRPDGSAHLMRGVVIFGITGGLADWARFYLEPVTEDGENADAAVRRQVAPGGTP